jgi:hydroxymethylpyrimidine pyrophosphatase-like HAD family hydrolase
MIGTYQSLVKQDDSFFDGVEAIFVDESHQSHSKSIKEVISKCKDSGVVFCFNSNRALEDMTPLYEELGLNGFIIGENGAFVKFQNEERIITKMKDDIKRLREIINNECRERVILDNVSKNLEIDLKKNDHELRNHISVSMSIDNKL